MNGLPQDERFNVLLHKKIMNKTGSAKRRAKKYYKDQYKKTGMIPKALVLAEKGIMEGRKCSGRKRVLDAAVKRRFTEMIEASSDVLDPRFIFMTQKARTVKNYHHWLEAEFGGKISLAALRRYVKKENLSAYLRKPDIQDDPQIYTFKDEPVFDLVQVDGCVLQYLKIRGENGVWQKARVIEFFDTGSRYMFDLAFYFSESSLNSVDMFTRFLLSTPFPPKTIRLRPDCAKGFLNLKRPIHMLNLAHSLPGGFHLKPDFARIHSPKDKPHLESSHRGLHNYEMRIIKNFEKRIAKVNPEYIFKNGKKKRIMITYLDVSLQELNESDLAQAYRREHNKSKHYFSVEGKTMAWIPAQKLESYLEQTPCILFAAKEVKDLMKYGYPKIKATVSVKATVSLDKQLYHVAVGREKFSRHKSTPVVVSKVDDKLFIFERKPEGILLGEAVCQKPFVKPAQNRLPDLQPNEVELIACFCEKNNMQVDIGLLINAHRKGLSLTLAKTIYKRNQPRYENFLKKLRQPAQVTAKALFNAFIQDVGKHQRTFMYER